MSEASGFRKQFKWGKEQEVGFKWLKGIRALKVGKELDALG